MHSLLMPGGTGLRPGLQEQSKPVAHSSQASEGTCSCTAPAAAAGPDRPGQGPHVVGVGQQAVEDASLAGADALAVARPLGLAGLGQLGHELRVAGLQDAELHLLRPAALGQLGSVLAQALVYPPLPCSQRASCQGAGPGFECSLYCWITSRICVDCTEHRFRSWQAHSQNGGLVLQACRGHVGGFRVPPGVWGQVCSRMLMVCVEACVQRGWRWLRACWTVLVGTRVPASAADVRQHGEQTGQRDLEHAGKHAWPMNTGGALVCIARHPRQMQPAEGWHTL